MSDRAFRQLLQVAAQISDRAADSTGFVPLAALAREMKADVRFRPLLVEGVVAQPKAKDGRWLVLIDNETHRVSEDMFMQESSTRPLGPRVRNTVAHELAHALGPRYEAVIDGTEKSRQELAETLERDTEQLSPALLIPARAIEALVRARDEPFDISELVAARDRLGVSSRVFVMRLELLAQETESRVRHHPRLENVVIGSGEWLGSTRVELHPMPFRGAGGLVPEFVALLRSFKKVNLSDQFADADFYLNGGSNPTSEATLWWGTGGHPQSEKGVIVISVEDVPRKADGSFLWLARRRDA